MAELSDPRLEEFCQQLARVVEPEQAYLRTHPDQRSANGSYALLRRRDVKGRIKEIQIEIRPEVDVTPVMIQLEGIRQFGLRSGDLKEERQASMDQAKLAGLLVDKQEVKQVRDFQRGSPEAADFWERLALYRQQYPERAAIADAIETTAHFIEANSAKLISRYDDGDDGSRH
jgi:hypothetical protein